MTEDEAKTKWCPMVRFVVSSEDQNSANRWEGCPVPEICCCLASDCMMWREQWKRAEVSSNGYCGFSGNGRIP